MTLSKVFQPSLLWVRIFSFCAGVSFLGGVHSCFHDPSGLKWIGDFLMVFVAWQLGSQAAEKLKLRQGEAADNDARY
ncbi:MAG: hypothetical protein WAL85_00355 [Candidatus Korobacteraceae bacterium]